MDIEQLATRTGKTVDAEDTSLLTQINEMVPENDIWTDIEWEGQRLEVLREKNNQVLLCEGEPPEIYTFDRAQKLRKYRGMSKRLTTWCVIGVCLIFGLWIAGIIMAVNLPYEPLRSLYLHRHDAHVDCADIEQRRPSVKNGNGIVFHIAAGKCDGDLLRISVFPLDIQRSQYIFCTLVKRDNRETSKPGVKPGFCYVQISMLKRSLVLWHRVLQMDLLLGKKRTVRRTTGRIADMGISR